MDHPHPLITFGDYRQRLLRWYRYDLPENATDAESETVAADVEDRIGSDWRQRLDGIRNALGRRMAELAWQHRHVEEQQDRF